MAGTLDDKIADAERRLNEARRKQESGLTMKGGGVHWQGLYCEAYQDLVKLDPQRYPQLRGKYRG